MRQTMGVMALVLAWGCGPGGIQTSEKIDDMRNVRSATWIEWQREIEGPDEVWHEFVMSSHGGLCKDLQKMTPDLADAFDDLLSELDRADTDQEECNALEDFYEQAAEITDPMFRQPLTTLSLTLRDKDDDREDRPPEDVFDQGIDNDPYFLGTLAVTEANPYAELAEVAADCPGDLEDELIQALRRNRDWYEVDRGEVEAIERGDEAYRLLLDGEIEDDDGDDAGDITARGTFAYCPVEWSGFFDPYDWTIGQ